MPKKAKKPAARLSYNLLMRELTRINIELPERKRLSLKERYELLSTKIYPLYKDVPRYKIRITEVRKTLKKRIKRPPRKRTIDVTLLSEQLYSAIDYYELDQWIKTTIQDPLWIKVSAGNYGETKIFNTIDYSYYTTGLDSITKNINDFTRQRVRPIQSGSIYYTGYVQLRPGKKNDAKRDSYYLELVLVTKNIPAKELEPVVVPVKKTKKRKEQKKKLTEQVQKRIKGLKTEKSRVKRIRQNLISEIDFFKSLLKKRYFSPKEKKQYAKRAFEVEKKKLDAQYKKKILNKTQYAQLVIKISEAYGKAK